MIVDCHAHIFEHWNGPAGHESRAVHAKYMQRVVTRTAARAFRLRDGAEADTRALYRAGDRGWSGLADVEFRVGRYGRFEFTHQGEDYAVQYMPVGMQELVAPPELMLAQMQVAGVDHCILQAGGAYGAMTAYNAFAQARWPARMTGLMHVDESAADAPGALAALEAGAAQGLRGLYFNVEGLARRDYPFALDAPALAPFWDRLAGLKLVLCIELATAPGFDRASYLGHLTALGRVLARHRDLRCQLAMGPPAGLFARDGRWDFPPEAEAVYRRERLVLEVMFPISWGGVWDYPYPEAQALIRGLRDALGADRLVWGSDMPNVERFCTYRQSLDYVRRYCGFLTAREKDLILGDTCAAFYGLGA